MSYHRQKAKELALHYFGLAQFLTADNRTEIEELVDHIVDAALEEIRSTIAARVDDLELRLDQPDWRERR